MFYGLASGAVDTGGIVVEQVLADIETLNRAAFDGRYEVTAVSFHAYAHLMDVRAAGARREHGRSLRPDRRRPAKTVSASQRSHDRDSRDPDDRVS